MKEVSIMRIFEYIVEIKEDVSSGIVTIEEIMYLIGRIIGWLSLFGLGFVGGSIIRGLLQGFGII